MKGIEKKGQQPCRAGSCQADETPARSKGVAGGVRGSRSLRPSRIKRGWEAAEGRGMQRTQN